MFLRHLSILNFKNYQSAELNFDAGVNCLAGLNGSGKTNLLDAVYYLAFSKSFFNSSDGQNIKEGDDFFAVNGVFSMEDGAKERISCSLKKGERKVVKRNGKAYSRYADHIGLLPLVMISPSDILLVIGGSEIRRKWIDGLISQYDRDYLEHLISYNKALFQRNALLKESRVTREDLDIWNDSLLRHGQYISDKRQDLMVDFIQAFDGFYKEISGGMEKAGVEYITTLQSGRSFGQQLEESMNRDVRLKFTTIGVHKDDLDFLTDGRPARKFSSQGQQKSLLLALRLAQSTIISRKKDLRPLLLLDDIYDKLDSGRMKRLLSALNNGEFGQLFITDTDADHLRELMSSCGMSASYFHVDGGSVKVGDKKKTFSTSK